WDGDTTTILLGNGDGTFSAAPLVGTFTGFAMGAIAAGDFNGDGIPDLFSAQWAATAWLEETQTATTAGFALPVASMALGTHQVAASYAGNSAYAPSASSPIRVGVYVPAAPTFSLPGGEY